MHAFPPRYPCAATYTSRSLFYTVAAAYPISTMAPLSSKPRHFVHIFLIPAFFLGASMFCDPSFAEKEDGHSFELHREQPEEDIRFEGGSIRIWWKDVSMLPDVRLEVSEITFEEDGLMLPQYSDSNGISYVLEGSGKVAIVLPQAQRMLIRRVGAGDVVAIPKGVAFWWYNDGYGVHKIFCASDTTNGVRPGRYQQFALAGARKDRFGGILHGFSNETLASAWGVDPKTVDMLLDLQNGTTIIKSSRRIILPDPRRQRVGTNILNDEQANLFGEFRYHLDREYPDVYVKRGGWMKMVNEYNLPGLRHVGISARKISLEKSAVEGPMFSRDAHEIIYVTGGHGRIEVSCNNQSITVQRGSVLVIPEFFPSMKIASDEGMSFVSFLTSPRPSLEYLLGRNSFLERIPEVVLAASFGVDKDTLTKILEARKDNDVIFPTTKVETY